MDQLDTMLHKMGEKRIKAPTDLIMKSKMAANSSDDTNVLIIGLVVIALLCSSIGLSLYLVLAPIGLVWKTMLSFGSWFVGMVVYFVIVIAKQKIRQALSFLYL